MTQALVVGGGPSGSVTALLLARAGWEVELVDRATFPRGKACGECLNPAGVDLLHRLELLEPVLAAGATALEGWEISPLGPGVARGRFSGPDRALGIERRSFDRALLQEARRQGVRVREGVTVEAAEPGDPVTPARVRLRRADGEREERHVPILIGADGLRSRVAQETGLALPPTGPARASLTWRIQGEGPSRRRGRLLLGGGCTVGFAPVGPPGKGLWNLTLVLTGAARTGRLKEEGWGLALGVLEEGEVTWSNGPEVVDGPWGSGSFHRPTRSVAQGRTLLVGDAAGYFDPLTGQGIFRAIRSARLAALALTGGQEAPRPPGSPAGLPEYRAAFPKGLRWGRGLQRAIDEVLSRSGPRTVGLSLLRFIPGAASGLIRLTGDRPDTILKSPAPLLPWPNGGDGKETLPDSGGTFDHG